MPLARRIERLDAAEPVEKTVEDILAVGIEYVAADRHPAPAQQIHNHAGPADRPAVLQTVQDIPPPSFGVVDHAQVEGAGEQRVVDRLRRHAADPKACPTAGKSFIAGTDHRRIDVEAQIPPSGEGLVRRQVVKKGAVTTSDIGDCRRHRTVACRRPVPSYRGKKGGKPRCLALRRIPEHALRAGTVTCQASGVGAVHPSLDRKWPSGRQPLFHVIPHSPVPPVPA